MQERCRSVIIFWISFFLMMLLHPDATVPLVDYGGLQKEFESQLQVMRLQVVPTFVGKFFQFLEAQLVGNGVMVVGLAYFGKSSLTTFTSKALSSATRRVASSGASAHQVLQPESQEHHYGGVLRVVQLQHRRVDRRSRGDFGARGCQ